MQSGKCFDEGESRLKAQSGHLTQTCVCHEKLPKGDDVQNLKNKQELITGTMLAGKPNEKFNKKGQPINTTIRITA